METVGVPDNGIENCWKIMGWKLLAYHGPWVSTSQYTKRRRQGYKRSIMVPEMLVRNENMIFGARACYFIRQELLRVYCRSTVLWNTGNLPVEELVKIWITIAEYVLGDGLWDCCFIRGWKRGFLVLEYWT
jgi:hypothetical protein